MSILSMLFGKKEEPIIEDYSSFENEKFMVKVIDAFSLNFGRSSNSVAVVGVIESGFARKGEVATLNNGGKYTKIIINDIEQFRKKVDVAKRGDRVGLMISAESVFVTLEKKDVKQGNEIFINR